MSEFGINLPTGDELKEQIDIVAQLLRNQYENGDMDATSSLMELLVLKYVTNDQLQETLSEIAKMEYTGES